MPPSTNVSEPAADRERELAQFGWLFEGHHDFDVRLAAWARKAAPDPDDQADLISDTWENLVSAPPPERVVTWEALMVAAKAAAAPLRMRRRREVPADMDLHAAAMRESPDAERRRYQLRRRARELWRALSHQQRRAVWHMLIRGLCARCAASRMDCSAATVRVHLCRGTREMRRMAGVAQPAHRRTSRRACPLCRRAAELGA
jgi:DNA-directed RNA polymerase specialized sigma24 family protein